MILPRLLTFLLIKIKNPIIFSSMMINDAKLKHLFLLQSCETFFKIKYLKI